MSPLYFGVKNLPKLLDLVDKKLKGLVPEDIGGLKRMLYANGKRLRPGLVIAIAHHSNKKIDDKVINAAAAVELVHLASLVHDDIIDGGTLRWGKATINSKEGLDSAILAGDYLFAKGCALASKVSAKAGEAMSETITELCVGQAIELNDQSNTNRREESLLSAIKGKTSSMFIASCKLGGLASELDDSQIKLLCEFAENFGITYQYLDDIKDFMETPGTTGKSVGNDIREGNYTLPVILSLQGPNKDSLKKLLISSEASDEQVLDILKKDNSILRTKEQAEKYKQKALQALNKLDNTDLAQELKSFANYF